MKYICFLLTALNPFLWLIVYVLFRPWAIANDVDNTFQYICTMVGIATTIGLMFVVVAILMNQWDKK